MEFYTQARTNMVKSQIITNHVDDEKLIQAMSMLSRQDFAGHNYEKIAYFDGRLPMGEDRTMLAPSVFARLVQSLKLKGGELVLDVACGTGYSTAILSQLCKKVIAVENNTQLAYTAANNFKKHNLKNVSLKEDDILAGAPEKAPFDAIFVNGRLDVYPSNLISQLKENGKLTCIMKCENGLQKAFIFEKVRGVVNKLELFDAYAESLS
jgi:protein-L-isoaspartate(D-aspartate) O-methyltransferase